MDTKIILKNLTWTCVFIEFFFYPCEFAAWNLRFTRMRQKYVQQKDNAVNLLLLLYRLVFLVELSLIKSCGVDIHLIKMFSHFDMIRCRTSLFVIFSYIVSGRYQTDMNSSSVGARCDNRLFDLGITYLLELNFLIRIRIIANTINEINGTGSTCEVGLVIIIIW